jgi:cilla- and flagella-associated protein
MLSENLVLAKTKAEKLSQVKNLNLWGAELTDISLVAQLINLEVLALSVNHVTTLRDVAECKNLRELYLRKNDITSLGEVYYLSKLPALTTLWLSDNPCAKDPNYRMFTVRCCPNLRQLDSIEVSPQERSEAQQLPASLINEIVCTRVQAPPAPQAAPPASQVAPKGPLPSVPDVTPPVAQPAPSPTPSSTGNNRQTQKTVLTAIVTLLSELNNDSLEILHREVAERMKRK